VSARYTGSPPAECLRFGVACGTESTQHLGAGVIDAREVERLVEDITVEPIEIPAEVS
jgi:fructose-1-phosphate kinase PfkB-like protein